MDIAEIKVEVGGDGPLCTKLHVVSQGGAGISGHVPQAGIAEEVFALRKIRDPMLHLQDHVRGRGDDQSPAWRDQVRSGKRSPDSGWPVLEATSAEQCVEASILAVAWLTISAGIVKVK